MDEAIEVSCIIDKLPPFWKEFKQTLIYKKEELTLFELSSHLHIRSPSGYNDNKRKRKHHDNTRTDPNKKVEPTCWKCGKTSHIKRDFKGVNVCNKSNGSSTKGSVDGRGCVDLRFNFGKMVSLFNVLHVPNIKEEFGF
nr:zinc finger, CCHC-type [Tanacetum cinerariifolium]